MGIHYGTAAAERVILKSPCGLRVRFRTENHEDGTQTLFALHPVTREILVQTSRLGEPASDGEGWREGHFLPPGAEFIGHGVIQ